MNITDRPLSVHIYQVLDVFLGKGWRLGGVLTESRRGRIEPQHAAWMRHSQPDGGYDDGALAVTGHAGPTGVAAVPSVR